MDHGSVSLTELGGDDGSWMPRAFYGQYRYALEEAIGGRFFVHDRALGAAGEVYLCYDREQEYFYALKTFRLSQQTLDDPHTLPRLHREVDKWIALGEHDHVVQCFGLEVVDHVPFLLLEWVTDDDRLDRTFRLHHQNRPMFLDWYARLGRRGLPLRASETSRKHAGAGTTLADWLRHYHTLSLPLALQLTLDICAGIQHAQHVHPGFVHCDLKPSNVLITERLHAKVTDFGTAQVVQELVDFRLPSGTKEYMAPEQWRGEKLDARADIYAIGCTLFEMLAGHAPFSAPDSSRDELRARHEHSLPPSLHGQVPAAVEQIVRTCLAKDPEERFPSLDAMIDALKDSYVAVVGHKPRQTMGTPSLTVQELNERGITYYHLGKYEQALACFAQAVDLDALYPNTYTNRGCVYHALGRYAEAMAEYMQALRLGRSEINSRARNNRGLLYLALNQPERAIKDFRQALDSDPQYANAYVNLGVAYAGLGRYPAAISSFDQALARNPHQVLAYLNRGYAFHQLGRVQEALGDYASALGLDPFLVQGYINRSVLYAQLGRQTEAEDDLFQAALHRPEMSLDPEGRTATIQVSQPDPHVANTGQEADLLDAPFRARRREQQFKEKLLGDATRFQGRMPLQPVVKVEQVAYASWLHERVLRRQRQGERLTQLTLGIRIVEADTLEETLPDIDECQIVLDEDAMLLMEAEKMTSIFDLAGRRLLLENDDPDDPQCPLRVYNIT